MSAEQKISTKDLQDAIIEDDNVTDDDSDNEIDDDSDETMRLKKENELLKKENELLKTKRKYRARTRVNADPQLAANEKFARKMTIGLVKRINKLYADEMKKNEDEEDEYCVQTDRCQYRQTTSDKHMCAICLYPCVEGKPECHFHEGRIEKQEELRIRRSEDMKNKQQSKKRQRKE